MSHELAYLLSFLGVLAVLAVALRRPHLTDSDWHRFWPRLAVALTVGPLTYFMALAVDRGVTRGWGAPMRTVWVAILLLGAFVGVAAFLMALAVLGGTERDEAKRLRWRFFALVGIAAYAIVRLAIR